MAVENSFIGNLNLPIAFRICRQREEMFNLMLVTGLLDDLAFKISPILGNVETIYNILLGEVIQINVLERLHMLQL